MSAILWIQDSSLATWIRESSWALFACLIVHTIGMGALAGAAVVANLRALGVAPALPRTLWPTLLPLMKAALLAAIASGLLLLAAYPAKALLNPVFYAKLLIIGAALGFTKKATTVQPTNAGRVDGRNLVRQRFVALAAVALWCAAVLAGKLLEYTHRVLLLY
jgi:hypothetical protein